MFTYKFGSLDTRYLLFNRNFIYWGPTYLSYSKARYKQKSKKIIKLNMSTLFSLRIVSIIIVTKCNKEFASYCQCVNHQRDHIRHTTIPYTGSISPKAKVDLCPLNIIKNTFKWTTYYVHLSICSSLVSGEVTTFSSSIPAVLTKWHSEESCRVSKLSLHKLP